jgi:diguanylate cyclase (GGDEF)-like protein/PAS domain S-box-containing protein
VSRAAIATTDGDARRNRLMARGAAALFLGEGVIALGATLAGNGLDARGAVVLGVAVVAAGLAALVLFGHDRLGRDGTHAVAASGAILIGVVVGVERPSYSLLYVWLVFFVASFFKPRAVVLHVAWMLACDGVAVWLGDPLKRPLESWLLLAGTLTGAAAFVTVVRRHLLDLAVRERESRAVLDTVFASAPVGLALFDRELRYVRVNETLATWGGVPAEAHVGLRIDEVHPGVGAQVEPQMRRVLETGEPVVGVEARSDGRVFRSSRYPVRDEHGRTTMIASVIDDVTELTRAHEQLAAALASEQESRGFADGLLEHAPIDLAFVDADLVYRRVNRRALESTGRTADEIVGKTVAEAYPELADRIEPDLRRVLQTGIPIIGLHMSYESPPGSGRERHWLVSRFPVLADDGTVLGVTSMRTDVTELKHAEARLEELLASEQLQARTDVLTGLANRAAFGEQVEKALARARLTGSTVAVILLDLDGFKEANDTLGHASGDELLRIVGERLRATARSGDTIARLGGDEFVLLLADLEPELAEERATTVAERIRRALERPFALGRATAQISASVGVALHPRDAADADALVAAADEAMYAAKRRRRALRSVG